MKQIQIVHIPYKHHTIKYNKLAINPYDKDIIPGVYEGGCKIWECTLDLLKFMSQSNISMQGKRVLDIGCGHGLLGIAALLDGADYCCFQDYNKQVLENITYQNALFNDLPSSKCKFVFGDWDGMDQQLDKIKFDLILGSQLIYNQANYDKILRICKKYLQPNGKAILANKHYYFGVGGNMEDFKEAIHNQNLMCESYLKICPPRGGNKKEIIGIYLPTMQQ